MREGSVVNAPGCIMGPRNGGGYGGADCGKIRPCKWSNDRGNDFWEHAVGHEYVNDA